MKKILLGILVAMMLVLSVSVVSATMSGTDITLGSDSTEAANPNYDDGDGKDSHKSGTFQLSSSGAGVITNVACTITPESGYKNINSDDTDDYEDDLDMNVTPQSTTIADNGSILVDVSARIPAQLDAVDSDGKAGAFKTATITCTGTEGASQVSVQGPMVM